MRSNPTPVYQCAIDLEFRYSRYFFIIKCIGPEPIIFVINLNAVSSSKVFFIILDYVFLSMVLLI